MPTTDTEARWLTPKQVADRLQVARRTLRDWDAQGVGPVPVHLTNGTTRYPLDAVEQWEAERLRAQIREQVARSRRRQGLPETVTDEAVLDRVAALIVSTGAEGGEAR
jgi:predicted site-specific integrase-resolvase